MNVGDVMTRNVRCCSPSDSLSTAARIMWENDCGCVPVVDAQGKPIGMVTDRDVCMAAYLNGDSLANIPVAVAASTSVVCVEEDDSVHKAEALMQKHQVRRIPVVDGGHRTVGILSMNDLARTSMSAQMPPGDGLHAENIVRTLAAVCRPGQNATAG